MAIWKISRNLELMCQSTCQCWPSVEDPGPASSQHNFWNATLAQHQTSTGSTPHVCWAAFNSTLVWQCILLAESTSRHQPNVWASTSCWSECLNMVYNAPMAFKCWPELYTMARHRTNARYTNTLPGQWWACIAYTGMMLGTKAGLMLAGHLWRCSHI